MIEINGKKYSLCLFDTNALSELLISPKNWLNYFANEFGLGNTFISVPAFSLSELYYRKELFQKYIITFSKFPSVILEGYHALFEKEVDSYFNRNYVDPICIAPFANSEPNMKKETILKKVFKKSGFTSKTEYWKNGLKDVLDGMLDLKQNYPPKDGSYSLSEIEHFQSLATSHQIAIRDANFVKSLEKQQAILDFQRFPSVMAKSYFVFYKFYLGNKKPVENDVFDIIISSLFPYVDYLITEGNNSEIVRQIQYRHNFLSNLLVYKVKDIKRKISYVQQ
jgi:hypothetical protein